MRYALLSVIAAGCTSKDTEAPVLSEEGVADYRALALNLDATAAVYGSNVDGPDMTTLAMCRSFHDQYDGQVRPWVSDMVRMSGMMENYMGSRDAGTIADFSCVSATMMDELNYHRSVACSSPDLEADRIEARRHVEAMQSYAVHMSTRCAEIIGLLDGGSGSFGPMMQGCQDWDGHCSSMMHNACCGGMMMHDNCDGP